MQTQEKKMRFFGVPHILPYVKPYGGRIVFMVFLGVLSSLIDSIYPLFNQHIINHNLTLGTNDTLVKVGIGYFLVLAFQVWDNYYSAFMCSKMELWLNRDLRNASFNHLQTLTFDYFNRNSVGYIHARVMSDSGRIGEFVSWRLMDFVWSGSYVVCGIIIMIATNLRLALLVLTLVPVAVIIVTFFRKKGILVALLFMLLFRFPEGQLVKIANPFLLDTTEAGGLALSTEAVGFVYGTVGIIGLTIGGLLGGWCVSRHGLKRWLWPMVLSIVFIEQFGYGFGFTAYMLYLVYFSQGERSTAVFSICTAMQALGMMLPGMIAGWMADHLGYLNFFWWVMGCCLVTFVVSAFIKIDPAYGKKEQVSEAQE